MLTLWAYAGYASRPFSLGSLSCRGRVFCLGIAGETDAGDAAAGVAAARLLAVGTLPDEDHGSARAATCRPGRRLILEKIPLLLLAAGSCIVTFLVQRSGIDAFVNVGLPWRIGNAAVAYVAYLIQFVLPDQSGDHVSASRRGLVARGRWPRRQSC